MARMAHRRRLDDALSGGAAAAALDISGSGRSRITFFDCRLHLQLPEFKPRPLDADGFV